MKLEYDALPLAVGNTPLVKVNRLSAELGVTIFVKIEAWNPAFSVKDRIGVAMIQDAEKRGVLKPGSVIVEPTSGNTGIALAAMGAAMGYKVILTMPETMSIERRRVVSALGAELILTPGMEGMRGAINKAQAIVDADPKKYFMPQQFENPANPRIHEQTTGPEIWTALQGKVDVLIAGVGTGGTVSGAGRYLKRQRKGLKVYAVEPAESPVISQALAGENLVPGFHKIQGLGAGFIPKTLDLKVLDGVEKVSSDNAIEYARRLARQEGLLAGISSGAAICAAVQLAKRHAWQDKRLVVVLPDAGERYLSTPLFDNAD